MAFLSRYVLAVATAATIVACALFAAVLYPRGVDFEASLAYAAKRVEVFEIITAGTKAHRAGKRNVARAKYEEALAIDPTVYRGQILLGTLELEEGNLDQAIEHLDRAIALQPTPTDALNTRGAAKWREGDRRGAMRDFDRALRFDPDIKRALINRGLARLAGGDTPGAVADLEKTVALSAKPSKHATRALIGLGVAHAISGDLAQARAELTMVVDDSWSKESILSALYNRARVLEASGDAAGAQRDREEYEVVKNLPDDAERFAVPGGKNDTHGKGKADHEL
jgi:tetratricopeptide (TPR) repeat protein